MKPVNYNFSSSVANSSVESEGENEEEVNLLKVVSLP